VVFDVCDIMKRKKGLKYKQMEKKKLISMMTIHITTKKAATTKKQMENGI